MSRKYFGTDGVRGKVGEMPITPDFVMKLGWAAGKVLAKQGSKKVLIGKDTRISGYMLEAALEAGAHLINDVSALRHDPRSMAFALGSKAPVVLMHAPGEGEDLHSGAAYADVVLDVFDWLRENIWSQGSRWTTDELAVRASGETLKVS